MKVHIMAARAQLTQSNTLPPLPVTRFQNHTRVEQLKPLVLKEIQEKCKDKEYFTRDHILYFSCMRQFSISYRIGLTCSIVQKLLIERKILKYNNTDLALVTAENTRRLRMLQKTPETGYAGRYTTQAADELLYVIPIVQRFNAKWLSENLECLNKLSGSTRLNYSRRIIEDLVRRGVLLEHAGFEYSVFKEN